MAPPLGYSCCLSQEQKEFLIESVHSRPFLWDTNCEEYQELLNRRAGFAEIAQLLSSDLVQYTGNIRRIKFTHIYPFVVRS